MRRVLCALAAASLPLVGCTTIGTPSPDTAAHLTSAVDRAQAAYDRIASAAGIVLPFLSSDRAARVRLAMALAERGLIAARYAATELQRLAALRQTEAATASIEASTS